MTTYIAYLFNTRLGTVQGRTFQSALNKAKNKFKHKQIIIRTKYFLLKKYDIPEEQIKELYELSKMFPSKETLTQKIELWFPECFKHKYEIGKWYKYIGGNSIVCYQGDGNAYGMGRTKWDNNLTMHTDKWIPATDEEVFSMLKKEAEKRGYKERVKVSRLDNYYAGESNTMIIGENELELYGNNLIVKSTNNYYIALMKDGKWATIVETPKEMTLEEIEKQLGHKVKIVS